MSDKLQKTLAMRCNWLFIATTGLTITLASCGGDPTVDPLEIGDPERGREIHETGGGVIHREGERGCVVYHSLDGSVGKGGHGSALIPRCLRACR